MLAELSPFTIWISIFGNAFELLGAYLMAHRYVNVDFALGALWSALYRGTAAKDAAYAAEITEDRHVISLQGLSLICVGFLITLLANLITAFAPAASAH